MLVKYNPSNTACTTTCLPRASAIPSSGSIAREGYDAVTESAAEQCRRKLEEFGRCHVYSCFTHTYCSF